MKLFTYSFEESQSFVNETIISRFNDKGNWKRFIGMPLFSAIVYLLYILLPAVFKGIRLDGDGDVAYQWLNLPLLFVLLLFYLVYIFYSFKFRKKKMILKYLTYCYMYLLLLFMELGFVLIGIFCRKLLGFLSAGLTIVVVIYLFRKVPKKIKAAVEERKPYASLAALATEKMTDQLLILGGSGVTAGFVLFDRSNNTNVRGSIDAILTPFCPAIMDVALYVFFLEIVGGYYLFLYYEQYKEKYDILTKF